jgi:hypothetical protein
MSYQKYAGAVRRFAKAMKFGSWLHGLPNKLTPPPFRLMQIGSAFWQSRALYIAARMDIVLPETKADLAGASFDMQMFMSTQGRQRTLTEWQSLFDRANLKLEEVIGPRTFGNILVLYK